MNTKLYTNVKLRGNTDLVDILVENGVFRSIGHSISNQFDNIQMIDLHGKLVLPPYVEPHIHLDYVYTAKTSKGINESGTLFEAIQHWSEEKLNRNKKDIMELARIAVKKQILNGVQYIRTHVDVTDPKLTALEAILELREELKDLVTIQIVAFPQEGMYAYDNGDKLVEEAIRMGADVVGGIPHFEHTRELGNKSVKRAIELSMKYNKLIDFHCDETDDEQSRFLEVLAEEAYRNGVGERTTASHTCAMGSYNNSYAARLFKLLKLSRLNFISCPTENLHLQGRCDSYPKRRGLTRVSELLAEGMIVCFAQDSIADLWYPLGSGNPMNILDAGIHACQLTSLQQIYKAFDLITVNGGKTLTVQDQYGISVGKDANFIILDAKDEFEAICERAMVLASIRKGEYIFNRIPGRIETSVKFLKTAI